MGGKKPKVGPLSTQATNLTRYGDQFLSYYLGGTLPPAQEAQLQVAQQRGDTAVRTAYANAGFGAGSTMQAQDEANVGLETEALRGQLLQPYLQAAQGFYSGASDDLKAILGAQTEYDKSQNDLFGSTIGGLFSALGGTDLASLFGSGAAAGGAAGASDFAALGALAVSDRRLKRDIKRIGTADNGLPIYTFRYIDSDQIQCGLMAQDVELVHPEAVITMPNGYKAVDYNAALS